MKPTRGQYWLNLIQISCLAYTKLKYKDRIKVKFPKSWLLKIKSIISVPNLMQYQGSKAPIEKAFLERALYEVQPVTMPSSMQEVVKE
jgi:hypothetical protein